MAVHMSSGHVTKRTLSASGKYETFVMTECGVEANARFADLVTLAAGDVTCAACRGYSTTPTVNPQDDGCPSCGRKCICGSTRW